MTTARAYVMDAGDSPASWQVGSSFCLLDQLVMPDGGGPCAFNAGGLTVPAPGRVARVSAAPLRAFMSPDYRGAAMGLQALVERRDDIALEFAKAARRFEPQALLSGQSREGK